MILFLDIIMYHFRQAVLDLLENSFLFEWIVPRVPGGFVLILIIPGCRREVPIQIKYFAHLFIIIEDAHLVGILGVIIYIYLMLTKHTAVLFPHGSYQRKPQGAIQANAPDLTVEFSTVTVHSVRLA